MSTNLLGGLSLAEHHAIRALGDATTTSPRLASGWTDHELADWYEREASELRSTGDSDLNTLAHDYEQIASWLRGDE